MIASLLQESNLTARQPCRAPITLYISFNKRWMKALWGCWVCILLWHQCTRCFPLLYSHLWKT